MISVDSVILQVDKEPNEICDIIEKCPCLDLESGQEVFDITGFRHINYFEFSKLPDYDPIVRIRVVKNQIWVEDKEDLPFYIIETLKEGYIPYTLSERTNISIDDFAAKSPQPINLKDIGIKAEVKPY